MFKLVGLVLTEKNTVNQTDAVFNQLNTMETADFVIKTSVCGTWTDIMTLFYY